MEDYIQYIGSVMGTVALSGAAAVATSLYMSTLPAPVTPAIDLNMQSREVPDSGGARSSRFYPDGKFLEYIYDDARTLYHIMHRGAKVSGNGPCLGWRSGEGEPYEFLNYKQTLEKIKNFSAGLVHLGMKPGQDTFIGIYSQNRVEWVVTEHACYRQSVVLVPLYDTLGPHACSYIINQANIQVVVCDTESKVKSILKETANTPNLKQIIAIQPVSDEVKKQAEAIGLKIYQFKEVEEIGKKNPCEPTVPTPPDVATVCYTSGTTGDPKGVVLTHANIISCGSAVILAMGVHAANPSDVLISYLPLAHMLERVCQVITYMTGGSVGFSQGNIKLLTDDIKTLKPTFVPAVPRLLNRIYDQIQNSVQGSRLKKWIMDMALSSKQSELERHIITNRSVWDKFVFKPVQENMGGRVRFMVTGSAPLACNVLTFLRCALGCTIVEGYGQTECVAPCTCTIIGDSSVGHVGPPLPCCHIKLIDVPEMEYFAVNGQGEEKKGDGLECDYVGISKELSDPSKILYDNYVNVDQNVAVCCEATDVGIIAQLAENNQAEYGLSGGRREQGNTREAHQFVRSYCVCVKGLSVCKGYLKDPVKTAETIDKDGWLHTGDIGMWMENGALRIVDRKKHIFKLAQGEYIAPEKIENIYLTSPHVAQIFVHGESLKSCLVAVVVPDQRPVMNWCKANEIEGSWTEICRNKNVKKMILSEITEMGKKAGLKSFEQVKDLYIHPELFTIENGLLTPTLKTKRPDCKKYFLSQIDAMYRHLA